MQQTTSPEVLTRPLARRLIVFHLVAFLANAAAYIWYFKVPYAWMFPVIFAMPFGTICGALLLWPLRHWMKIAVPVGVVLWLMSGIGLSMAKSEYVAQNGKLPFGHPMYFIFSDLRTGSAGGIICALGLFVLLRNGSRQRQTESTPHGTS